MRLHREYEHSVPQIELKIGTRWRAIDTPRSCRTAKQRLVLVRMYAVREASHAYLTAFWDAVTALLNGAGEREGVRAAALARVYDLLREDVPMSRRECSDCVREIVANVVRNRNDQARARADAAARRGETRWTNGHVALGNDWASGPVISSPTTKLEQPVE